MSRCLFCSCLCRTLRKWDLSFKVGPELHEPRRGSAGRGDLGLVQIRDPTTGLVSRARDRNGNKVGCRDRLGVNGGEG
ncbi:hypothetical protein AKJ16_DCAP13155 [Drosera capensis]